MITSRFVKVSYPEPHKLRNQQILAAHPDVKELFGPDSKTAVIAVAVCVLQVGLAMALADGPWWAMLAVAYFVGAFANHALFVIIHDATHNLIYKSSTPNKIMGIIANLPIGFPMALSFRKYHLLHHKYQGDPELDADLATPVEVKLVGNNVFMKAAWLFSFALVECLRPVGLKKVKLWDKWTAGNLVVQVLFDVAIVAAFGWGGLIYLVGSTIFSVGLHPVGARWIQEHYIMPERRFDNQETYSYYGVINKLALNVGYHNEHHDFMLIPWSRLPQLKAKAPEFYDSLYSHYSWTVLLFRFLFDRSIGLDSRVIRDSATAKQPVYRETSAASLAFETKTAEL